MNRFAPLAAMVAALLLLGGARADPLPLETEPVQLHPDGTTVDRIGALRFLGGLRLRSTDSRFGGLSGLHISAAGARISFVSDVGYWVQATPIYDAAGRLTGIDRAEIGPLRAPDGKPVKDKRDADAESLAAIDGGIGVTFERNHRLWVYRGSPNPFLSRPRAMALPLAMRDAPANRGVEAFAVLADGRPVIIAEDFPSGGPASHGWVRTGERWARFDYAHTGLFLPTGMARLPGGDLLVLERRFTYVGGLSSRLARVAAADLKSGALVRSRELARLQPPFIVENFEGVAVRRDATGRTLVYLVSDDNFNILQRTLLLLFALPDE